MGPISIFRYLNSEYPNIEMHYLELYFRDENRELLECGFCSKISIYKDRVKNIALLEMLLFEYLDPKNAFQPSSIFIFIFGYVNSNYYSPIILILYYYYFIILFL